MSKSTHTPSIRSDYLDCAMNPFAVNKMLKKAVPFFKKYDFQAFAFRGISGALIAPLLAHKCKKSLIAVRKPKTDETCHACWRVESDEAAQRYIIVDDFISSGRTVTCIITDINEHLNSSAICLGGFFYSDMLKGYEEYIYIKDLKLYTPSRFDHVLRPVSDFEIKDAEV